MLCSVLNKRKKKNHWQNVTADKTLINTFTVWFRHPKPSQHRMKTVLCSSLGFFGLRGRKRWEKWMEQVQGLKHTRNCSQAAPEWVCLSQERTERSPTQRGKATDTDSSHHWRMHHSPQQLSRCYPNRATLNKTISQILYVLILQKVDFNNYSFFTFFSRL